MCFESQCFTNKPFHTSNTLQLHHAKVQFVSFYSIYLHLLNNFTLNN